jgi:hypothetical protein
MAVALSEELQRNAKHEARFSNISDQRLKAWPRGLHPLRCSFASLRMTAAQDFARSNLLTLVE